MSLKSEIITLSIANDSQEIDIPIYNLYNIILRNRLDAIGIHMELLINDETDIYSSLPIKGGEVIHIIVDDSHGNQIDKEFKIINARAEVNKSEINSLFYIEAVEAEAFELLYTRLHQNWNETKISDIVTELVPDAEVEATKNKVSITNPNWSINKFVQKLTDKAINSKGDISYLFYQDYDAIRFTSLDTVIDENDNEVNDYVFDDYNPSYRYNVLDWKDTSRTNFLDDQAYNVSNNQYIAYNPDKKEFSTIEKKTDDISNTKMGKASHQSKDIRERKNKKVTIVDYHGDEDFENTINNDIIFKEYNISMDLLLNFDIGLKVGSIVNLLIPTKYNSTELNQVNTGKWIVSKVIHQFNPSLSHTKVEVIRNASYDGEDKTKGKIVE